MNRIRRLKRAVCLLLAAALLAAPVSGCAEAKAGLDLTGGVSAEAVDASGALTGDAVSAAAAFSMELFRRAAAAGVENTLVSPVSVLLALGMTANGADGETLKAFEQVLGQNGQSLDKLNLAYKALSDALTATEGGTTLKIANSIWCDKGFAPYETFLQTDADYYGSAVFNTDLQAAQTVRAVNQWVEDRTNGLIKDMVEEISPQAAMLLFNTLYLKAAWQRTFNPNDNYDGTFTLDGGGEAKTVYMSNDTAAERYISKDGARGVLLPYDDGRLAYLAVLPPEGVTAAEYVQKLDENSISGLLESAAETQVRLSLPKYTAEYAITLKSALSDMGLSAAFDGGQADFSRMADTSSGNLYIGEVTHKTYIAVNELGTEAAAATSVEMRATSAQLEDPLTLSFDRPFVYAVVQLDTGLPVFIGVLDDPSAAQ